MGVSLLSEAATSVSMFIAEPNPALNECYLSMHTDIKHKKKKKKLYLCSRMHDLEVIKITSRSNPSERTDRSRR